VRAPTPRPAPQVRRGAGVAAGLLAVLAVVSTFPVAMPAHHYVAVPVAMAVASAAWIGELAVPRWPRPLLIAAVVAPQLWLTSMAHVGTNLLFLQLLCAWLGYRGSRAEALAGTALSLATNVSAVYLDWVFSVGVSWYLWLSWCVFVVASWIVGALFRRQERLLDELRALRGASDQRARELATLLTASRSVASMLDQEPLMHQLLDDLKSVVDYSAVSVRLLMDGDLVLLAYRGADPEAHRARARSPLQDSPAVREVVRRRAPFIIRDFTVDESELLGAFRRARAADLEPLRDQMRAWLGVPLIVRDEVLGAIVLSHAAPGFYSSHHAELALAFANHAAVAIQNARLYAQVQQTASLEERQKLARELHDSVSQALYGIALGARTARTLLDREPERAKEPVEYVLQLAEAGIAEMRALIFELRPESLAQEGLVAALQKHAASLRARYQLTVESDLGDEPDVPLSIKEALYRVAQEALHNTVKHAQASHVTLRLAAHDGTVSLEVGDDGAGFEPHRAFPGHLGLTSMRERLERAGGALHLDSAPGQGTRVRATLPAVTVSPAGPVSPAETPVAG
jgi:signal transduction histidine kinase